MHQVSVPGWTSFLIMMWKTVPPRRLDGWEPMELRMLKQKLANLDSNCRCGSVTYEYNPARSFTKESTSNTVYQLDQNLQTEDYDITPNEPKNLATCDNCRANRCNAFNIFNKNDICPACYFTQNMWRLVQTRFLKDEEIETNPEMFSCDKSTSKTVQSLEAATSLTFKPVLKSSCLTIVNNNNESMLDLPQNRSNTHREVTFAPENQSHFVTIQPINLPNTCSYCACARVIDSIRPRYT